MTERKVMSELQILDATKLSDNSQKIRSQLFDKVIGQTEAINSLVNTLSVMDAGLHDPSRPRLVSLFAGATGVGKSYVAKQLSLALFGTEAAVTQINCGAMSKDNSHYSAGSLLGSASGYVGDKNVALLSPRNTNKWRNQSHEEMMRPQPFILLLVLRPHR
jgi:ATP-dependent Clp protease ATP-binding subunit ClpA